VDGSSLGFRSPCLVAPASIGMVVVLTELARVQVNTAITAEHRALSRRFVDNEDLERRRVSRCRVDGFACWPSILFGPQRCSYLFAKASCGTFDGSSA
jgi:hypothetical protein